jgi:hypothetical protein
MSYLFWQTAAEVLCEEVHKEITLSGPEKDDVLGLPDIGRMITQEMRFYNACGITRFFAVPASANLLRL